MRREILFRGKRTDTKEWIEGNHITDEQNPSKVYIGYLFGVNDNGAVHDTDIVEVEPETICQYTSYTDLRKKKAFEHDIIFYEDRQCHGHIVFKDGCFLIEWEKGREDLKSDIHFWFTERRAYVVGNAFDNPELLNQ